jgi:REP element-mobilizing transposase RayT
MTYARKSLISLQDTPYYHVIARCVRRARLWGVDEYAGQDYSHRKHWVTERLAKITRVFAIEVCAYAVMSNHYHLVLRVDAERTRAWTEAEVIKRWTQLFRLPLLVGRYLDGTATSKAERLAAQQMIAGWRTRLHDVSWLMRVMNEYLARRANEEDQCTGRFWEGRFKSQALLDEAGLLTAMVYVDLNPVRAGIAKTPEDSEFTSIYERIRDIGPSNSAARKHSSATKRNDLPLLPFGGRRGAASRTIPCSLPDYLKLVDWTGRAIRKDKPGHIDSSLPPILTRLNIDAIAWQKAMQPNGSALFGRALGRLDQLRVHAARIKQSWIRGQSYCTRLYG